MTASITISHSTTPVWPAYQLGLDKLRQRETAEKQEQVRLFLSEQQLDGVWLTQPANIIWLTDTAPCISLRPSVPVMSLLLTRERAYLLVNGVEQVLIAPPSHLEIQHYNQGALTTLLERLSGGSHIGCDAKLDSAFRTIDAEFSPLRLALTPTEQYRYRMLCQECTTVLENAARAIQHGQTEQEAAADIAGRCYAAGITPTLLLVSANSGLRRYRHSPPSEQKITHYAILALEGTQGSLHAALTRMVVVDHALSPVAKRHYAAAYLSALSMELACPDRVLGELLREGLAAYEAIRHPARFHARLYGIIQDYERHHPKGAANLGRKLQRYQALTLIAAINGIQSQDTFLLLPDRSEMLTTSNNWPMLEFSLSTGRTYRPDILWV